ncbi:MAG: hypothetical protein ACLUBL_12135 [Fusobacterium sp.]|uniref:hypothetical protein n=1 Tax=Fusobacterium sp. TaxID=68766 RepID=UPI003991A5A5
MGKSDHKFFNCSEEHEREYIIRQYPQNARDIVRSYLYISCVDGTIKNSTHEEVYNLIKTELGLDKK